MVPNTVREQPRYSELMSSRVESQPLTLQGSRKFATLPNGNIWTYESCSQHPCILQWAFHLVGVWYASHVAFWNSITGSVCQLIVISENSSCYVKCWQVHTEFLCQLILAQGKCSNDFMLPFLFWKRSFLSCVICFCRTNIHTCLRRAMMNDGVEKDSTKPTTQQDH